MNNNTNKNNTTALHPGPWMFFFSAELKRQAIHHAHIHEVRLLMPGLGVSAYYQLFVDALGLNWVMYNNTEGSC